MNTVPTEIKLNKKDRHVEIIFDDGVQAKLSCEFLRVFSPSAEIRDHNGERKIIGGKQQVNITAIEPIGNYAVKFIFDDGHNSGIYTWELLHDYAKHHSQYWKNYLEKLHEKHLTR